MSQISQTRIDKILEWAVTISFMLMILTVVIQVVSRYALPWSPHWTEEMARFCFIYMVSLGAGLAIKERAYINVSIFLDGLNSKGKIWMDSMILFSIMVLMLFMLVFSLPLVKIVSLQDSASMRISMGFIYFSMTCMSFFVAYYSLLELLKNFGKILRNR
jgi:TRAP-type C4-dicarboxylate transport system permease small subunit